jgi:hypothetical protein
MVARHAILSAFQRERRANVLLDATKRTVEIAIEDGEQLPKMNENSIVLTHVRAVTGNRRRETEAEAVVLWRKQNLRAPAASGVRSYESGYGRSAKQATRRVR